MSKTIGILTGGGDCPGLNAVIRGVVRAAVLRQGWKVIGIEDGFDGLVSDPPRVRPLGTDAVRGILPRGGTILGTSNRGNPFSYPMKDTDGTVRLIDASHRVVENVKRLGIDALITVGGDGTLKIAQQLCDMGIPVVAVPKTIDNDLRATDVTFGYRTAVETVTEALDRLHSTAESHHRVIVVEVMGRDAGWIAIESGIAGSADVILIPEIPFTIEQVCAAITRRCTEGSRFSIVVVAEGAFPATGNKVVQASAEQNHGIERLGGVGRYVADQLAQCLTEMETRVVVLGHVQRGGSPCPFDRILGSRFGVCAVELIAQGKYGRMVALRSRSIVSVPLQEAIGSLNTVDPDGELVTTAEALGIYMGR